MCVTLARYWEVEMIQKIYKAIFCLEDLREIHRETVPEHHLSDELRNKFESLLNELKKIEDRW